MLAHYWLTITLVLGLLVTGTFLGLGLTVRQWRRHRPLVPLGQVWLRLAGGGLIQGLWVLLGVLMLHPAIPRNPHLAMKLFYIALGLVCLLPLLALLDVWLTLRAQLREEARLTRDFATFLATLPPPTPPAG